MALSAARLIGDIFQAGMAVGIFLVVAVIALAIFLIGKVRRSVRYTIEPAPMRMSWCHSRRAFAAVAVPAPPTIREVLSRAAATSRADATFTIDAAAASAAHASAIAAAIAGGAQRS